MKLIGGLEFSKYDDREMAQQDKGSVIIHFDIGAAHFLCCHNLIFFVIMQFNISCVNELFNIACVNAV